MKIIRHTARDMRQALRAVREQLGEDAVILSSRRTGDGVEVTAAVDFDASSLEAGGFSDAPVAPPAPIIDAEVVPAARSRNVGTPPRTNLVSVNSSTSTPSRGTAATAPAPARAATAISAPRPATSTAAGKAPAAPGGMGQSALVLTNAFAKKAGRPPEAALAAAAFQQVADETEEELDRIAQPGMTYDQIAASREERLPVFEHDSGFGSEWISEAAREAVVEHAAAPRAPVLSAAPELTPARGQQAAHADPEWTTTFAAPRAAEVSAAQAQKPAPIRAPTLTSARSQESAPIVTSARGQESAPILTSAHGQ